MFEVEEFIKIRKKNLKEFVLTEVFDKKIPYVASCLAIILLVTLFPAKEYPAVEGKYDNKNTANEISNKKVEGAESIRNPYYETHVYIMVPEKSLNIEQELYYTKEFADANGEVLHMYEYIGQEELNGREVVHYHNSHYVINCDNKSIPGEHPGYEDFILQNDAHGAVIGGDLGWYFEYEFEAVPTSDWFTYKGIEPIYVRYAFKVAKTNGEIQADGYTVKYANWVGKKMDFSPKDVRLWAVDQEGLTGGSVNANFRNGDYYNWNHFPSKIEDDGEQIYEFARFDVTSGYVTGIFNAYLKYLETNDMWGWSSDGEVAFRLEYSSGKTEKLVYYLDNVAPTIKKISAKSSGQTIYKIEDKNLKIVTIDGKAKKIKKEVESLLVTLEKGTHVIMAEDKAGNITKKEVSIEESDSTKISKTNLISVKSKQKKAIMVTWKKNKDADGYQLQYATKKNFSKGKRTVLIKKGKTTKYIIKKLKSNKTYYIRIRAYKTVKGKKSFGTWSDSKKVKVK